MAHAAHVPADFESTFRHRFAPLFGRKIGRQRAEQYLGGLLGGRAERRNVTSLAGTVDGASARALGWLLNKSPWTTRPIVDTLQVYVGDTFGAREGLYTLSIDSFVKRGDNAVGVEKQYVHHLGRTQNCQIGVFLAYGAGQRSALVDAALYMPRSWTENIPRREKAGVPENVEYQPRSALAIELLSRTREAGHLPGAWVTTWHGEGFEADLRARLDAEGWCYLLPVPLATPVSTGPDAADSRPIAELVAAEGATELTIHRAWVPTDHAVPESGGAPRQCWLLTCPDVLTGETVALVSNAPEDTPVERFEHLVAARWDTARMLMARRAGVSLNVYRVRGWDGWHRHVALALLASAFRACLPALTPSTAEAAPDTTTLATPAVATAADALSDTLSDGTPTFREPVVLQPEDSAMGDARSDEIGASADGSQPEPARDTDPTTEAESQAAPLVATATVYRLVVDLEDSDWRAVRAFQTWLVADEAGTILSSSPTRAQIENQDVGPRMEVRFASAHSLEQVRTALDEVPEIVIAELVAEPASGEHDAPEVGDDADLLAALHADLSARTSAGEAGSRPAFEGAADVIGSAMDEASRTLEPSRELVAARGASGHRNGNGNGHGASPLDSLSVPAAPPHMPPTEAPVRRPLVATPPSAAPSVPSARPAAHAPRPEEGPKSAEKQMVVLDVGDEAYGIPIQRVREIIRVPPITRVPNGPAFLEGVINLRGQVIPVLDLRKHLGILAGAETRRSRVVVSELGRHTVGLVVDGVSQVVMVAATDIEPPPPLIAGAHDGQVCGVTRIGERLVLCLDPDRVLPNR